LSQHVYRISTLTGLALVVANMIGTGAFTSLGFQLQEVQHPLAILILWLLGGVLALAGALSYAELGTVIKKSGGEYTFLSGIYHPLVGYLSGWISLTVGFAAPVALSAIAVVEYFPYGRLDTIWTSLLLVGIITFIHTRSLQASSNFQNLTTLLKVLLILALIVAGLLLPVHSGSDFGAEGLLVKLQSSAFAVALIYVSYAYSGWNAAIYIAEEFRDVQKSLPVALVGGTLLVTLLYTLLQFVFLKHNSPEELTGQLNVGAITAQKILGERMGKLFSLSISLLLISGISAMVWVGPRVTSTMARDHRLWYRFRTAPDEIPVRALWLQFAITAFLLLTGTFEQILIYCGMLLTLSSLLTVLGVFWVRNDAAFRNEKGFRSPLYPFFQLLFLVFSIGMIGFTLLKHPVESLMGGSNLLLGWLSWRYRDKILF
jgi:APA family basic amino acid/polyamine antiporter